jgi:hypothetical protein
MKRVLSVKLAVFILLIGACNRSENVPASETPMMLSEVRDEKKVDTLVVFEKCFTMAKSLYGQFSRIDTASAKKMRGFKKSSLSNVVFGSSTAYDARIEIVFRDKLIAIEKDKFSGRWRPVSVELTSNEHQKQFGVTLGMTLGELENLFGTPSNVGASLGENLELFSATTPQKKMGDLQLTGDACAVYHFQNDTLNQVQFWFKKNRLVKTECLYHLYK